MPSRTSAELAAYLCEAAGTKLFFEYREEAQASMEQFERSAQTIHQNIRLLSEVVQREGAIVEAYREHRENGRHLKLLDSKKKHLNHCFLQSSLELGSVELCRLENKESDVLSSIESTKSELGRLQQDAEELKPRIAAGKETSREYEATQLELVQIGTIQEATESRIQRLQKQLQVDHSQHRKLGSEISLSAERRAQTDGARLPPAKHVVE